MARPRGSKNRPKPAASPPAVSVVIPCAGDPFLAGTVRDILATAPGCEVIVVWDGTPGNAEGANNLHPWPQMQGVGPSRDAGIAAASGDIVVTMDAHTKPHPGWLSGMLAVLDANPAAVAVARCGICNWAPDNRWHDRSKICTGANLRYQTTYGNPLEPDWIETASPGQLLKLALGGTYAIRRDRYNAIGVPWRRAIGWGSSEQTLCLVNWFLGGETILADATADHIIWGRDKETNRPNPKPWKMPEGLAYGAHYNRLRLIDLLPMPDDERSRMTQAVLFHALRCGPAAQRMLTNRSYDEARDAMGLAVRTWEEWCAFAWPGGTTWITPRHPDAVAVVHRAPRESPRKPGQKVVVGAGREVVKPGGIPLMQCDQREWL